MDLTQFDSRTAAEKPGRMHLCAPVSGGAELYADGDAQKKPCVVLVYSTENRKVQAARRALQQAKVQAKGGNKETEDVQVMEDLHAQMVKAALPLISGFENISRGENVAGVDDAEWFLNLQMYNGREGEKSFVEQVLDFANSRSETLGNVSTS